MDVAAPHRCPYCQFPVWADGVTECTTCGGILRQATPGRWVAATEFKGQQRVAELERRINRLRVALADAPTPNLPLSIAPLALLGSVLFGLWKLGEVARLEGHGDAFALVVIAAGLVAFSIYMLVETTMRRHRSDRGRRRALKRLRRQKRLLRHSLVAHSTRLNLAIG